DGSGQLLDYCVAVDAATGANIWATPIGNEPWDPNYTGDGGAGIAPYYKGDGPRTTPAVKDGRVVALAGQFYGEFHLVCMNATNGTPVVATIQGVRQVVFATRTGLVSLERSTGTFLWKFTYPFAPIDTSMGASPVVYSNMVYCTAGYNRGAAAVRVALTNGA